MKVGDLVVQSGWEADGVGIITRVYVGRGPFDDDRKVTVQWPMGPLNMYRYQLEVISESR